MNTQNIISNLEHKSNPTTPRRKDMKYESSSDVSVTNSAKSSARGIKKTINWRDYFNPKELKKIEEIEEE
jgi:hypothetical protein